MTNIDNGLPTRRRTRQIWVDPSFLSFIKEEYPHALNPERTRKIMDRLLGLNGIKKNFKKK